MGRQGPTRALLPRPPTTASCLSCLLPPDCPRGGLWRGCLFLSLAWVRLGQARTPRPCQPEEPLAVQHQGNPGYVPGTFWALVSSWRVSHLRWLTESEASIFQMASPAGLSIPVTHTPVFQTPALPGALGPSPGLSGP